jgi:5-methylcytosine-specific restriction endonuclease McrA
VVGALSNWGQGGSRNWRKIRQEVLERDAFECQLKFQGCTWAATEVHHRAGIAASGLLRGKAEDEASMCISVCQSCHQRISAKQSRAAQAQLNANRAARRKLPQMPHPGERR